MTATVPPGGQVELAIGGMICASCATRVERKLNKLDRVTATVNYATERARVSFPGTVTEAELVSTVEAAGYTARLPEPPEAPDAGEPEDPATRALRQRLLISVVLAVPVVAMTMIPAFQRRLGRRRTRPAAGRRHGEADLRPGRTGAARARPAPGPAHR